MKAIFLEIAFRAYAARYSNPHITKKRYPIRINRWPRDVLTFDTETTTNPSQRLLFGSFRHSEWKSAKGLTLLARGFFYHEELPTRDPDGFARLQSSAQREGVPLYTVQEFLDEILWPAYKAQALLLGFNLSFDLSRLAYDVRPARGRFRGGFSLILWVYRNKNTGQLEENPFRPRIVIKHLDSKRSFFGFTRPKEIDPADLDENGRPFTGRFLDLKTGVFAITNQGHSLASACRALGVEHGKLEVEEHGKITGAYIDYNLRDTLATEELLVKWRAEFDRHPIDLDPCKAYSPASIVKAYLLALGVTPPDQRFADSTQSAFGAAMNAYYGGRAECKLRKAIVGIVYLDFLSMYPTVFGLMGMQRFLIADRIATVDCKAEVEELLAGLTRDSIFNPGLWPQFTFFARVVPDDHPLPVRAKYGNGDAFNIGVNYFKDERAFWYAGPDVIAATLDKGTPPRIVEAFKIVPVGIQVGLKPTKLRDEIEIDPRKEDIFCTSIEIRKTLPPEFEWLGLFLKVFANSGAYGINAQFDPEEAASKIRVLVFGPDEWFEAETKRPENPGRFCFPPFAALITAAARLMLSLLEMCVREVGGSYVFCDTDSMAIVATQSGGDIIVGDRTIHELSWAEVRTIVDRFAALNPYNPAKIPGSILKIEDENSDSGNQRQLYAYAISSKRYVLFNLDPDGRFTIRKYSEHGFGHLLNPTDPASESRDWIRQLWEFVVAGALNKKVSEPVWLDRPALSRITATSPSILKRLVRKHQRYPNAIKPFNFLLAAHINSKRFGHPAGVDPKHFQLIAPYTSDSRKWSKLIWTDIYSGDTYAITTRESVGTRIAIVKSYRDVLDEYVNHPEPKSAGPDGIPCGPETTGALERLHVRPATVCYVSEESNHLDDVEADIVHDWDEVRQVYRNPRDGALQSALSIIKAGPLCRKEIAEAVNITRDYLKRLLNRRQTNPSLGVRNRLTNLAARILAEQKVSN